MPTDEFGERLAVALGQEPGEVFPVSPRRPGDCLTDVPDRV
jgi:hypothetical protein